MSTSNDTDDAPDPDTLSGALLRHLREAAGLSQSAAARASGVTQPTVSRVEKDRQPLTPRTVAALLAVYAEHDDTGLTEERVADLIEQAERLADEHTDRRVILQAGQAHNWQLAIRDIEQRARRVRSYHPATVIGSLQARSVIEAVFTPDDELSAEDARLSIEARAERGRMLLEPGRDWYLVQTEQALRWPVRDYGLHAGQLDHIADLAGRLPNVSVRVIALDTLAPAISPVSGFHIYDDGAGGDATVLVGTALGTARVVDPAKVTMYAGQHAEVSRLALSDEDSVALLRDLARHYRGLADR